MENDHTSHELLAHLDSGEDVVSAGETTAATAHHVRDARWVLKWAAAFAILVAAVVTLLEFGYLMAAERILHFAARAGVMEATLPRATYESVQAAVERRLFGYSRMQSQLQLTLLRNGQPAGKRLHAGEGMRFSVVVTAPAAAALPWWLTKLTPWRTERPLLAHAERAVPGRQLQRSHF